MTAPWLTTEDPDYETARMPWNVFADQHPAAVVQAESVDDVVDAIQKARAVGLRVAVQGTGHAATARNDLSNAVLVRTEKLNEVKIDPRSRVARVGAGVVWQQVAEAAAPHGLAGLAGSSGGVGVVGYSIGGGVGWLARAHGLACSRIVGADVVLASGAQLRVDDVHEPDLLWALRGGGGSFAAVTSLEIELVPVEQTYSGSFFFPVERAAEVLSAWRRWADTLPEKVTSTGRMVNIPPLPQAPEPLRGKSFALVQAVCLTDAAEGAELVQPLRDLGPGMDTVAQMPPTGLGMIHMDPPDPVPADLEGWLLTDFGDAEIDAMVAHGGPGSPLVATQVRHLGGAVSRPSPHAGAVDSLAEPFGLYGVGVVPEPAAATAVRSQLKSLHAALGGSVSERRFSNLAEECDPASLYSADAYERLRSVRRHYDPDSTFICVHAVGA